MDILKTIVGILPVVAIGVLLFKHYFKKPKREVKEEKRGKKQ